MNTITFKDYKKAIKEHYGKVKNNDVSGILANPSPAQMRTLCSIACDKGISKKEEDIFRLFFETKENESLKKSIDNCNIDKFRTIISFLKGERDSDNNIRVEVSAIIVDYKPRPYNEFSKLDTSVGGSKREIEGEGVKGSLNVTRRKAGIGIALLLGAFSVCYTAKNMISPEKQCMQWQDNHYELVDCKSEQLGLTNVNEPKPYDEIEFKRKKLKVCDTTTFFKSKKAIVWYSKVNNVVEFFNIDGVHPENGDELKHITQHMIDKYVTPCK